MTAANALAPFALRSLPLAPAAPTARARRALLLVLALLFATAGVARAQMPKGGATYYEDKVTLGFKVKNPKDWEFIPPQPNDKNLIGKYDPPPGRDRIRPSWMLPLGGNGAYMGLHSWLLKFDRRERVRLDEAEDNADDEEEEAGKKDEEAKPVTVMSEINYEDFEQWAKDQLKGEIENTSSWRLDSKKEVKVDGLDCSEIVFLGLTREQGISSENKSIPVKAYAMVYHLEPHLDVAYMFSGPGRDKDWKEWETNFRRMAETFKRIPLEALPTNTSKKAAKLFTPGPPSALKDKRRAELQARVAAQPGWTLMESPNYFFISNSDDNQFIAEVIERIETIRKIYEKDYPQEKSRATRAKRKITTGGADTGDAPKKDAEDEDEDARPEVVLPGIDPNADPAEVSRTSVVRICDTYEQFLSYSPGATFGVVGYWAWRSQELVLFDSQKIGNGRSLTWSTLSHEAFHQFIFYFYGNIAPHSWYNEGTGDYYGGFSYKGGKFVERPDPERNDAIKEMLREDRFVPLKELVRWSQATYYSPSKYKTSPVEHYAEGWSIVWFLRTGKGKAKGWDPSWELILDRYLEVLGETGKTKKAVEAAFDGVDFDALERAWKAYVG